MPGDEVKGDIETGNASAEAHVPPTQSPKGKGKHAAPPKDQGTPTDITNKKPEIHPDNPDGFNDDLHDYQVLKSRFYMQALMSGTVTAFCIIMMAVNGKEGIYLPVLTGILGYWLPSPDPRVTRSRFEKKTTSTTT